MGYYRHSISQAGNRESECELGSMSSRYGFSVDSLLPVLYTGLEGESPQHQLKGLHGWRKYLVCTTTVVHVSV